jgi:hypothetical protein
MIAVALNGAVVGLDVSAQDRRSHTRSVEPSREVLVAEAKPLRVRAPRRFESMFGKAAALDPRAVLKQVATADFG